MFPEIIGSSCLHLHSRVSLAVRFVFLTSTTLNDSLSSGRSAFSTAAYAYFSDCSDPSTRSALVTPLTTGRSSETDITDHVYSLDFSAYFASVWRSGQRWVQPSNVSPANLTLCSTLRLACMSCVLFTRGSSFQSPSYLRRWMQHGALEVEAEAGAIGSSEYSASSPLSWRWLLNHERGVPV